MNRRELAKNGFMGLFGALLGKLPEKPVESPVLLSTTYLTTGEGGWKRIEGTTIFPIPECADGYSLSDGTEIEHGSQLAGLS